MEGKGREGRGCGWGGPRGMNVLRALLGVGPVVAILEWY